MKTAIQRTDPFTQDILGRGARKNPEDSSYIFVLLNTVYAVVVGFFSVFPLLRSSPRDLSPAARRVRRHTVSWGIYTWFYS